MNTNSLVEIFIFTFLFLKYSFHVFIVVDLLFLESTEVLFRVSMALLEEHQDQLLMCDSFEEIMEYLKVRKKDICGLNNFRKWLLLFLRCFI